MNLSSVCASVPTGSKVNPEVTGPEAAFFFLLFLPAPAFFAGIVLRAPPDRRPPDRTRGRASLTRPDRGAGGAPAHASARALPVAVRWG